MGSHNKETTLLKAKRENARRMPRGNRRKRGRRRGRRGGNLVICFSSLDSIIPFRSKQPKMPRLPLSLLLLTQLSHFLSLYRFFFVIPREAVVGRRMSTFYCSGNKEIIMRTPQPCFTLTHQCSFTRSRLNLALSFFKGHSLLLYGVFKRHFRP